MKTTQKSKFNQSPQRAASGPLHPERLRSGFTLMELLVTVSIIAILAAILLPTINSAIERSEVAEAEAEVQSIATAVQAYYNEYSKLPMPSEWAHGQSPDQFTGNNENPDVNGYGKEIVYALLGYDDGDVENSRGIVFLKSSGNSTDGTFKDPWDNQYAIKLDTDYDGKVEYFSGNPMAINAVVVSYGPDGEQGDPSSDDDIVSSGVDQ